MTTEDRYVERIVALKDALRTLVNAVNWYHGNGLGDPYDERKWVVVVDAKDAATKLLPDYRYKAPGRTKAVQPDDDVEIVDGQLVRRLAKAYADEVKKLSAEHGKPHSQSQAIRQAVQSGKSVDEGKKAYSAKREGGDV